MSWDFFTLKYTILHPCFIFYIYVSYAALGSREDEFDGLVVR